MIATFDAGDLPPPDRGFRAAVELAADTRPQGRHDDDLIPPGREIPPVEVGHHDGSW